MLSHNCVNLCESSAAPLFSVFSQGLIDGCYNCLARSLFMSIHLPTLPSARIAFFFIHKHKSLNKVAFPVSRSEQEEALYTLGLTTVCSLANKNKLLVFPW